MDRLTLEWARPIRSSRPLKHSLLKLSPAKIHQSLGFRIRPRNSGVARAGPCPAGRRTLPLSSTDGDGTAPRVSLGTRNLGHFRPRTRIFRNHGWKRMRANQGTGNRGCRGHATRGSSNPCSSASIRGLKRTRTSAIARGLSARNETGERRRSPPRAGVRRDAERYPRDSFREARRYGRKARSRPRKIGTPPFSAHKKAPADRGFGNRALTLDPSNVGSTVVQESPLVESLPLDSPPSGLGTTRFGSPDSVSGPTWSPSAA